MMDAPVLAAGPSRVAAPVQHSVARPLCLGLLLLAAVFNQEVVAAVQTWMASTAYNHCFLIIPIALYLLRERRAELSEVPPTPTPVVALLGVPLAMVWLAAERLGIMEGRQLAAVSFAELLFLAVLGRRLWWAACGPLLYLYFLVPFGEFLTPWLQDATTSFIRHGLEILGVPAFVDGYVIEIPQGTFFVAAACAGLRFLIASIAFGCLYALMMYRSPVRRCVFVLVSTVVPIVANGLRGLGIVYLGYWLGSAQAAATDHILYGWIFFSVVILLLIVLGLPFREDGTPRPPTRVVAERPAPTRSGYAAVVTVAVVAALAPTLAAGLAMAAGGEPATTASIDIGPGCAVLPGEGPRASGTRGGTRVHAERVVCGGVAMDLAWEVFSPRVTAGPVMAARRQLSRQSESETVSSSWMPDTDGTGRAWWVVRSNDPTYVLATAILLDGKSVRPGLATRAHLAASSLLGRAQGPMVLIVSPVVAGDRPRPSDLQAAEASLLAFLRTHADLDARASRGLGER